MVNSKEKACALSYASLLDAFKQIKTPLKTGSSNPQKPAVKTIVQAPPPEWLNAVQLQLQRATDSMNIMGTVLEESIDSVKDQVKK